MKTTQLTRQSVIALPIAGLLCISGCGGSGGSSSGTAGNNPYAASYAGNFIDQNDFIGTFTMTVSSTGVVNGSYDYNPSVSFTGSINSSGDGSITSSRGTYQVKLGAPQFTTLGGGTGTTSNGSYIVAITNPTGLFNGLSGAYSGTVDNTTLGATGIIAFTVSSTGVVSGVDLFHVNGVPTLEPISGTLSSGGALSYTVAGVTVTGNVSLSGQTLSGPLSESDGDSATMSVSQVQ